MKIQVPPPLLYTRSFLISVKLSIVNILSDILCDNQVSVQQIRSILGNIKSYLIVSILGRRLRTFKWITCNPLISFNSARDKSEQPVIVPNFPFPCYTQLFLPMNWGLIKSRELTAWYEDGDEQIWVTITLLDNGDHFYVIIHIRYTFTWQDKVRMVSGFFFG